MRKRIMACFISLVMVLGIISSEYMYIDVKADDTVIYDADQMDTFAGRTAQEVADKYSAYRYSTLTYENGNRTTWFSEPSSTENPYAAGVLTEDTHKAMTDMTNFYRWLVGVKTFDGVSQHSDSLQAQALVRNFQFAHYVSSDSKPADMSQELWDAGAPCNHNILAIGYTPQGAITGWMNEGYRVDSGTWDTLGHRYTLIGVGISDVQFGYSGSVAIGDINGYADTTYNEAISAFPAPGYMPNNVVYPYECAWAVDFDTTKVKAVDEASVSVKVTNLTTGASYSCTEANNLARVSSSGVSFAQPSDNTGSYYTDSYAVEVTGLTDTATGKTAIVRYTVRFFDAAKQAAAPVVSASAVKTNYIIYKTLGDTENLKKIASIIPQEMVVTNDLGDKATIKTKGPWILDEANKCFVNSADASALPANMKDINNILSSAKINYTISEDRYDMYNTLRISPSETYAGESVTFSVYRTNISTDTSQIYQLKKDSNGNYYGIKRFDSATSAEFDTEGSSGAYHYYTLASAAEGDGGEYLSIYYNSSRYWDEVYVSTSFETLNVYSNDTSGGTSGDGSGGTSDEEDIPIDEEKLSELPDVNVYYRTHIQNKGWEGVDGNVGTWRTNGAMSGTSGQSLRLEAINVAVAPVAASQDLNLGIQYTTHCQNYGWLPWSSNGDMNGTEGESKRLEAIMLRLTGEHAKYYDVYYRVHAQSYGWLGWAKNGSPAGTAGYSKRLEGIQIVVVKKGADFNRNVAGIASVRNEPFVAKAGSSPVVNYPSTSNIAPVVPGNTTPNVAYRTHVQKDGWQGWKFNGQMSGTSGRSLRLEGINIKLTNRDYSGGVRYRTHIQNIGWEDDYKYDGVMSGTSGRSYRLEAIQIELYGEMAEHYDIYYRVHAQNLGWLNWAKNGESAGTAGYAYRLEGIQTVLVPKGQGTPSNGYGGIYTSDARAYVER